VVFREHSEIERVIVVEHTHFGVERGRTPLTRFILNEARGDRRIPPGRFFERTIQRDRSGGTGDRDPAFEVGGLVVDPASWRWYATFLTSDRRRCKGHAHTEPERRRR